MEKLWVKEKLLMIRLSIKDKSNNYLDNFKDIYRKVNQLRNLEKCYGSLIMTSILNINPDPAIVRERIYQDYIHAFGRDAKFGREIDSLPYPERSTLVPGACQCRCI
jgi:hypothetical protein